MATAPAWSVRSALVALAVQATLVVWLTWPLATSVSTRLPATRVICSLDALPAGWTLAWETHALTTDPTRLLDTNIYHPQTRTLFYGPTFLGALPVFGPPSFICGRARTPICCSRCGSQESAHARGARSRQHASATR